MADIEVVELLCMVIGVLVCGCDLHVHDVEVISCTEERLSTELW